MGIGEGIIQVCFAPYGKKKENEEEDDENEEEEMEEEDEEVVGVLPECVLKLPREVLNKMEGKGEEIGTCVYSPLEDLYSLYVDFPLFSPFPPLLPPYLPIISPSPPPPPPLFFISPEPSKNFEEMFSRCFIRLLCQQGLYLRILFHS